MIEDITNADPTQHDDVLSRILTQVRVVQIEHRSVLS